jgi:hypothetical protein
VVLIPHKFNHAKAAPSCENRSRRVTLKHTVLWAIVGKMWARRGHGWVTRSTRSAAIVRPDPVSVVGRNILAQRGEDKA